MRDLLGEERFKQFMDRQNEQKKDEKKDEAADEDDDLTGDERIRIQEILTQSSTDDDPAPLAQEQQKKFGKGTGGKKGTGGSGDYRNFSPDKKLYAFVKNHNLYVAEADKEDQ